MRLVRRSSTGTLWYAVAADGPQQVLFKLIHPRLPDAELHATSARSLVGVEHPGLLRVADAKRLRDDVLVVAATVTAPTLAEVGDLQAEDLLRVAADVAGALSAMHARGLAHLDVRPAAVLVPGGGHVRPVDLGAGRVRARTGRDPRAEQRMAWLASELPAPPLPATDAGARLTQAIAAATRRRSAERPTAEEFAALLA